MSRVHPGRHTAAVDGPFVVLLIGMRINRFLAMHKWIPVARAMGPMVEALLANRDSGLLHAQTFLYWRGVALVQYWRSFEHVERFARQPGSHLDAWKRFNQSIGADGSVGIWHETYMVPEHQYECIYGNMPLMGLACAGEHMPATGRKETARRRLGGEAEPAVASYDNPV